MIEILEELLTGFAPTPGNLVIIVVMLLVAYYIFYRIDHRGE